MQNGGEGKNSLVSSQVPSQRKKQVPLSHETLGHGPLRWRIKADHVGRNWRSQSPIRELAAGDDFMAPLFVGFREAIVPLDCDLHLVKELGIIF